MATSFELAGHVVGLMIDQDISSKYLKEIHSMILEKLEEYDEISLFCEIMPGNKVPMKAVFEDLVFKYENSGKIKKMAFVSDITWLRGFMDINGLLLSSEIRTFEFASRLEAIEWISR